MNIIWFKKIL